jgi:hypothetical protein
MSANNAIERTADPRHASCVRTCRASGRGPLIADVRMKMRRAIQCAMMTLVLVTSGCVGPSLVRRMDQRIQGEWQLDSRWWRDMSPGAGNIVSVKPTNEVYLVIRNGRIAEMSQGKVVRSSEYSLLRRRNDVIVMRTDGIRGARVDDIVYEVVSAGDDTLAFHAWDDRYRLPYQNSIKSEYRRLSTTQSETE